MLGVRVPESQLVMPFLQVQDGNAAASIQIAELNVHLQKQRNQTLSELQQSGSQLYLGVFVTNIQSKGHCVTLYSNV